VAYTGYYSLGGNEIVNAARAERYVEGAAPLFGLRKCVDTNGLENALGETYGNPVIDQAPWYDPTNPVTAEFWGVYPLDVEGIEDSVREVGQEEALGNGTVFSKPRETGRDIRFNVLLLGSCEAALDAGQQWLNRALEGSCGAVAGCDQDDLCFFSEAPPLADWSACPETPMDTQGENGFTSSDFPSHGGPWELSGLGSVQSSPNGQVRVEAARAGSYAFRLIEGLVPGATYRLSVQTPYLVDTSLEFELSGVGSMFIDHSGIDEETATPYNYDFVATATSVTLKAIPVVRNGSIPTTTQGVLFSRAILTRVAPGAPVYHSEFRDDGTPSAGWQVVGTTSVNMANGSELQAFWPTVLVGTNTGILRRSLRGMRPGRRYRLTALYFLSNDDGDLDLSLSVNDWPVDNRVATDGSGMRMLVSEFTAQADLATFSLILSSTTATNVDDGLILQVVDLLDITDQTDIMRANTALPTGAENLARTLYKVTATQGAITAEEYKKDCGAMRRVTFALRAGVPDVFGPERTVGTLLGGSSLIVPDYSTCADGVASRVNYMANPSIEVDTTGWTATGTGSPALTRVTGSTNIAPKFGTAKLQLNIPGTIPATNGNATLTYSQDAVADFPIIPGGSYVLSFYVAAYFTGGVDATIQFVTTDGVTTHTTAATSFHVVGVTNSKITWQRFQFVMPNTHAGNLTNWKVVINLPSFRRQIQQFFYLDGLMLENGTQAGTYFDGTINGGVWTGTVGKSISTLTPAPYDPTVDPNCPQPPLPPQPPSIDDTCIVNPGTWRRYVLPISRQDIPGFGAALPIMTITSGSVAVRQARIRFFANPLVVDFGSIDPCSFCGEVQVSYIPPGAVFTIDGVRQIGTVNTPQSGDVSASHLLYGSANGGPVDWPELSCGIDYFAVVDLDASADVSQVDVSLSLGVMI